MIRFTDALTLAFTKLQTHKVRTAITVIIPSLLFGVLFAIIIISEGAFQSISSFSKEGYGSRFMVSTTSMGFDYYSIFKDPNVIARAKEIYKENVATKKAAAKELGINYEDVAEEQPITTYSEKATDEYLSMTAPSAIQAYEEYQSAQTKYDLSYLKNLAKPYEPIGYYSATTKVPKSGSLVYMKDGKENLTKKGGEFSTEYNSNSIESALSQFNGVTVVDHELSDTFLLTANEVRAPNANAIPVIITYGAAEKLLKLPEMKNASEPEKLDRIKDIQSKANSINFSVCYRNSESQQLIDQTIALNAEIEKNKNNKDFQTPSTVYQLPTDDSCGPVTIKSDARTAEQKSIEAKYKQFYQRFGISSDPDQQKIEFYVIGLMPNGPDYTSQALNAATILQLIVSSSTNYGLVVPADLYNNLPSLARYEKIFEKANGMSYSQIDNYVVEFNSAEEANKFITEKSCSNPEKCLTDGTPFWLSGYGSNSIALDGIKTTFLKVFSAAVIVVVVIAAIIMSGTLGRMVADGRRETAVFRAIGFKRIDIASIYITYIIIISIFVAITSFAIGAVFACVLDYSYWQEFTTQSLLSFGASDITREFHFFKLNCLMVAMIAGSILGSGLISAVLPLARNIRRNPIKDMRDE